LKIKIDISISAYSKDRNFFFKDATPCGIYSILLTFLWFSQIDNIIDYHVVKKICFYRKKITPLNEFQMQKNKKRKGYLSQKCEFLK
jgi:hypothetical protein